MTSRMFFLVFTSCFCPLPRQSGQACGFVPALAPLPPQSAHRVLAGSRAQQVHWPDCMEALIEGFFNVQILREAWPYLVQGLGTTLLLSLAAVPLRRTSPLPASETATAPARSASTTMSPDPCSVASKTSTAMRSA